MALIFETNFENGSFIDKVGGLVGTPKDFVLTQTNYGIANRIDPRISTTQFVSYPITSYVNSSFTYEVWYRFLTSTSGRSSSYTYFIGPGGGGNTGIGITMNPGTYFGFEIFGSIGGRQSKTITGVLVGQLYHVVFCVDFPTRIITFFRNGKRVSATTAFADWGTITQQNNLFYVGNSYASTTTMNGTQIYKAKIYNHICSEKEILNSCKSFTPSLNNKTIYMS